jgi:hypothetical protein
MPAHAVTRRERRARAARLREMHDLYDRNPFTRLVNRPRPVRVPPRLPPRDPPQLSERSNSIHTSSAGLPGHGRRR